MYVRVEPSILPLELLRLLSLYTGRINTAHRHRLPGSFPVLSKAYLLLSITTASTMSSLKHTLHISVNTVNKRWTCSWKWDCSITSLNLLGQGESGLNTSMGISRVYVDGQILKTFCSIGTPQVLVSHKWLKIVYLTLVILQSEFFDMKL